MEANELLKHFLPFMLRFIAGALFFFQAYDKLFRIGLVGTADTVTELYREIGVPLWFVRFSVGVSTYIELIGGVLLLLGLFKTVAIVILGINLMMVTVAFGMRQGMWDAQHVFVRLVLLVAIGVMPESWDAWTLQNWFDSAG